MTKLGRVINTELGGSGLLPGQDWLACFFATTPQARLLPSLASIIRLRFSPHFLSQPSLLINTLHIESHLVISFSDDQE